MGHYGAEIFPMGMTERDRADNRTDRRSRELSLRKELDTLPLSKFTVGDLGPLMRLTGLVGTGTNIGDLEQLERRVVDIKTGQVLFNPQPEAK